MGVSWLFVEIWVNPLRSTTPTEDLLLDNRLPARQKTFWKTETSCKIEDVLQRLPAEDLLQRHPIGDFLQDRRRAATSSDTRQLARQKTFWKTENFLPDRRLPATCPDSRPPATSSDRTSAWILLLVEDSCVCIEYFRFEVPIFQRTASHCNTLQHTAARCSTLQCTTTHCNALQHTAARCSTLQHTAAHCNTRLQHTYTATRTLQHTATHIHCNTHCNTQLQHTSWRVLQLMTRKSSFNKLQHTATHCNTVQHTQTHCSTCNTLQHAHFPSTSTHHDSLFYRSLLHVSFVGLVCRSLLQVSFVGLCFTSILGYQIMWSHVNESCHVSMHHFTCQWVT